METDTAFVRPDGVVELYAVAQIDLDFALVVHPRNAEGEDTLRLDKALDYFCFFKFRMLVIHLFYRKKNFFNGLQVLLFAGVLGL